MPGFPKSGNPHMVSGLLGSDTKRHKLGPLRGTDVFAVWWAMLPVRLRSERDVSTSVRLYLKFTSCRLMVCGLSHAVSVIVNVPVAW